MKRHNYVKEIKEEIKKINLNLPYIYYLEG